MASSSERALHGGPGFAPSRRWARCRSWWASISRTRPPPRGERRCEVRGDGGLALAGLRARDLNQLDGWREVAHGARECGKGLRRLRPRCEAGADLRQRNVQDGSGRQLERRRARLGEALRAFRHRPRRGRSAAPALPPGARNQQRHRDAQDDGACKDDCHEERFPLGEGRGQGECRHCAGERCDETHSAAHDAAVPTIGSPYQDRSNASRGAANAHFRRTTHPALPRRRSPIRDDTMMRRSAPAPDTRSSVHAARRFSVEVMPK